MNEGIGRNAWTEQVITRFNPARAKMEVIGYEFNSYDKINGSGLQCSFNYSTRTGFVTKTAAQTDEEGNDLKVVPGPVKRTVTLPKEIVELNDWKSSPDNKSMSPCSSEIK